MTSAKDGFSVASLPVVAGSEKQIQKALSALVEPTSYPLSPVRDS